MAAKKKKGFIRIARNPLLAVIIIAALLFFAWQSGYLDDILGKGDDVPRPPVDGTMELHVIDIGQGDSLLIKTSEGCILIDSGDKKSEYEEALLSYLKAEGVAELEYVIFTHMDADHIGNAVPVLQGVEVKRVIMPDLDESDIPTTNVFENMIAALEADEGIEVISAAAGTVYTLGGMTMKVLGPLGDDYPNGDRNNYSVCVRLDYGETSFLLTGDAEERAEEEMLARYKKGELDCDFFKAAHHGSSGSNTAAFLAAVSPDMVAVSCGEGNKYGHPHAEAMERFDEIGATTWRTDLDGDLVFVSDGMSIVKE